MSTPISAKHSLYKPATPLERSSLVQGKLTASFTASPRGRFEEDGGPVSIVKRERGHPSSSNGVDPSLSPRRALPSPSLSFPTEEHTHLLSLSDSDLDTPPPPAQSSSLHVMEPHPPTLLTPGTPSPVTVVAHSPPDVNKGEGEGEGGGGGGGGRGDAERREWRRFSSNFVSPPLVVREPSVSGEGGGASESGGAGEGGDATLQGSATLAVLDKTTPASVSITTVLPVEASPHSGHVSHDQSHDQSRDQSHDHSHDAVTGIGRSCSEEVMSHRLVKNESLHLKSAELSTIHEHSDASIDLQKGTAKKKGKKAKIVPSRYLSSSSTASSRKPMLAQHNLSSRKEQPPMKNTASRPVRSRPDDSFRIPALPNPRGSRATQQLHPSHHHSSTPALRHHQPPPSPNLSAFTPSGLTASTPAVGMVTSSTHHRGVLDGSFVALSREDSSFTNTAKKKVQPASASKSANKSRSSAAASGDSSSGSREWELELQYSRLLQATYLDIMSSRALKEQENEAKSQLYSLWQAVEGRKRENHLTRKMIETEQRMIALEKSLETQLQGLGPVCSQLAELESSYGSMAQALDTTRHDLVLTGVCALSQGELETELVESEQLLGDILSTVWDKIPKVCGFADSMQATVKTLKTEYEELECCWEELGKAVKTQIHETSLYFEEKQRQ